MLLGKYGASFDKAQKALAQVCNTNYPQYGACQSAQLKWKCPHEPREAVYRDGADHTESDSRQAEVE